ncbi:hypothetical protein jhhlp_006867 [Lomentospora prolificans]|uniref:Deacetylase complex subunit n=1 Tax=Lomentospora prolificans TaxID=41688 RepID=A0A2N3N302_9PEZI|nr:hypothetical protein jhhlp_006867 [Lomentospora prolificans]
MATTEPAMASGSGLRPATRRAEPQAPSKRDKKRQLLNERIAALSEKFDRNRDSAYVDQLQKIQVDTSLVQRIDPYAANAASIINDLRQEHRNITGPNPTSQSARSLLDMAGPKFQDWAQEISDLHERKDIQLSNQHAEYERKVQEFKNVHSYRVETAKREHQALASTLRDRLINSLAAKKNRLNKEKEALELSDSSALLFHPNQFSITNPASPGGTHGKRATRLRKDAEDIGLGDSKKRKRATGDDDGSPAPSRRALDTIGTTPLWQSEKLRVAAKQNGPIYSVDKLFTDKELTLTYNTAAQAAHMHILRHRVNGPAGSSSDGNESSNDDDNDQDSADLAAPMMERAPSHATRSTRGTVNNNVIDHKIVGFEAIADYELPGNLEKIQGLEPPKLPPIAPSQYSKPPTRSQDQNTPVSLANDTINEDVQIMSYFKQFDAHSKPGSSLMVNGSLKRVLEAAATPNAKNRYVAFVGGGPRRDLEEIRRELGLPSDKSAENPSPEKSSSGLIAAATASAAAAMSRQSSQGGVAMSRTGTNGSARGKGRKN